MTHPLDRPALRPLWTTLHQRLSSGTAVRSLTLTGLTEPQRDALADLLGLDRRPGVRHTVNVRQLDEIVADVCDQDARRAAEAILGPIGNRSRDRQTAADARTDLWAWLHHHPSVTAAPALAEWAAGLQRAGLIGRSVTTTRTHLTQALTVLDALPAPNTPLSVFAAHVLEDAHALDPDTRLSTSVLRALAHLHRTAHPDNAPGRRALWARAGICDDALSATVLTGGLRPAGTGPVAVALRALSDAGHAAHLTLAQLRAPGHLTLPTGPVYIFENPSVLALALDRFGPACPPLVCTSGWPNTPALLLLQLLRADGAELRYHGDFDGEGLRIAGHVQVATGAIPWRMTTADYLGAPAGGTDRPRVGRVTPALWDPDLAPALEQRGAVVLEEHIAHLLLDEIAFNLVPKPAART